MVIKELRESLGLTQVEVSNITAIPLRTYKNYENDPAKIGSIKYQYIVEKLKSLSYIDEEHGILTIEKIIDTIKIVFTDYQIEYCYLFGSYSKNKANEKSDVDLLISTPLTGLKFYGLVEKLRTKLKKRVDVIDIKQLENNPQLLNEILKDGLKIYG